MRVGKAEQLQNIDKRALEEYGLQEIVLMENAGHETMCAVRQLIGAVNGRKIIIAASKGNNGGDGFVAARHLANEGAIVEIVFLGNPSALKGSALINYEAVKKMEISIGFLDNEAEWELLEHKLAQADCIVDALLGTGFRPPLRPAMERLIKLMNQVKRPVAAIDIPSGVEADNGHVPTSAVKADLTATFGIPKLGLYLYPGAEYSGQIIVSNIGIPEKLLNDENIKQNIIHTNIVQEKLVERPAAAHKGSCGRVLVLTGSRGMTGAAVLSATAALRAGAGLVTLGVPDSVQPIVAAQLLEVMTSPLPDSRLGIFTSEALAHALELAAKADIVVIGPGLGRAAATGEFVREFLQHTDKQVLIDADAIYLLAEKHFIIKEMKQPPIITPHVGEMAVLTGQSIADVEADLLECARKTAIELNAIVVLKSARTVVAGNEGSAYINVIGNAGMATAGSGDVLTGVISGLAAQKMSSIDAAVCGVYLHSRAGDIAAQAGMHGLIAGDIVKALPKAQAIIRNTDV